MVASGRPSRCQLNSLADFNPLDPQVLSCPHAWWAAMRRESPVHKIDIPGVDVPTYCVTRKRDIEDVCRRTDIFSGRPNPSVWRWADFQPELEAVFADGGYKMAHTLQTSDPPVHSQYRAIATQALSRERITAMGPRVQGAIDELLAGFTSGDVQDFVQSFAIPLPLWVICDLLGLPRSDADFLVRFTDAHMRLVDPTTPLAKAVKHAELSREGQQYLVKHILERRDHPSDDFLSTLANAKGAEGQLLTLGEALSMAFIVVVAGNETTRNALGSCAYELARHPEIFARLKKEPDKVVKFVEEVLRTAAPANTTVRTVLADTEIGGTPVPKGANLFILWGSGGVDEAFWTNAEQIDLGRQNPRAHTTFGYGARLCAGNQLARMELNFSVESWLREFQRIELAAPADSIHYMPVFAMRALKTLPLRFIR